MRDFCSWGRWFLAWVVVWVAGLPAVSAQAGRDKAPTPVIHITDLHRPHNDPDDHWDLACVYALAHRGDIELKGVVIDYPPQSQPLWNPDLAAVAQMNRITGLAVPVAVGTPYPVKSRDDAQPYASATDHQGIDLILNILRTSDRPVVIHVIGGCRDIAVAGRKAPDLFARKCAAVYLNAGTGQPKKATNATLEYNVTLDKPAYQAVFDLPCPIYWMPCFETLDGPDPWRTMEFGTYYRFRQGEILPYLSQRVQSYFAYMFARKTDHAWLRALDGKPDEAVLTDQ
ncbi:MAG: nucleoside hydrolase, partial [Phycisphaerales bacterium]